MFKFALRVLGLVLVVWSVGTLAPVSPAHAQASVCGCSILCSTGRCCAAQVTGGCFQICIDAGDPCPSNCGCSLLCSPNTHCCSGVSSEGQCTQSCIDKNTPCPRF